MRRGAPFAVLLALAACADDPAPVAPVRARPEVRTTFYPTTWMARRIAGDRIDVVCPLPEGEDPATWQPSREDLDAFQKADLILLNGAHFEKWVDTASLPQSRTVDTCAGFRSTWITFETAVQHRHGNAGEHSHEGVDGHTWVSPVTAILQVEAIGSALKTLVPAHAAQIDAGGAALTKDLAALADALRALGPLPEGRALAASHPAYNYLCRDLGWPVINFDFDPGIPLTEEQLARFAQAVEGRDVRHILWESEPLPACVEALETRFGVASVFVSPCESVPESGDFLDVMKANVERLRVCFEP